MKRFRIEDIVHPEMHMVAKQFVCAVCLNIVEDPVQTLCSHIFCRGCVSQCELCPSCREPFGHARARLLAECNKPMMRLMQDIKVHCPYHSAEACSACQDDIRNEAGAPRSVARPLKQRRLETDDSKEASKDVTDSFDGDPCSWSGSYGDLLIKHLQDCPHHWIDCPRGCGEVIRRRNVAEHAAVCAKGFEACKHCGERVRPDGMAAHMKASAELHVQILEEKLAAKTNQEEAGAKIEKALATVARTQHVTNVVKQRTEEARDKVTEQIQELKQEMWDCMRKKIVWRVDNWPAVLRRYRKGSCIQSHEFTLRGFSLSMKLYPNGDLNAGAPSPNGQCALYIEGPEEERLEFSCRIGAFKAVSRTKESGCDFTCVECSIPSAAHESVDIVVKLVEYVESVGTSDT